MSYLDVPTCDILEISELDKFLEEISDLTDSGLREGPAFPVSQDPSILCSHSPSLSDKPNHSELDEYSTSASQHELQQAQNLKQPTKRSAAWTAKNRRAQQRVREKQKARDPSSAYFCHITTYLRLPLQYRVCLASAKSNVVACTANLHAAAGNCSPNYISRV